MVSSDSDYFESADEENEEQVTNQKIKKKLLAKKEGNASRQTADSAANVDEGWDDFDIEGDLEDEKNLSLPPPVVNPVQKPVIDQPTTSGEVSKMAESGWEDFDDWEESNPTNKQQEPIAKPSSKQAHQQNDKSVVEKMSNLDLNEQQQAGWGWNSWGVGNILSSASVGISTISSHVSQSISTVTNALETGIGAPNPEELAKRSSAQNGGEGERTGAHSSTPGDAEQCQNEAGFAFNSLISGVSHITKLVESTGTKVISGGLGTLETIGKKTMEVLQEGDPGLQKKRAFLGLDAGDKPVLSQVLREAKEKADAEDKKREDKRESKQVHYETLFDDFEGLVNLEALEMLSRQVSMQIEEKIQAADSDRRKEIKETMQQVAELCECVESDSEDESEEEQTSDEDPIERLRGSLDTATSELGVEVQLDNILSRYKATIDWLANECSQADERSIYKRAVSSLAEHTAISMHLYLRTAQLLVVKQRRSTADEADSLAQLNTVLTNLIKEISTQFTKVLLQRNDGREGQQINDYVTNIFLEAGNSTKFINNAFQLILPILQIGAV